MAYDRRTFAGGAVATTLSGAINGSDLSIPIAATTGWPTGSAGDFGVVIDRGTASEEKVLVDTRSGSTLTVVSGGRGVDGTSATSHSSGATIEVCIFARDVDEPNAHLADTALDHHTQYHNNTRGDARYPLKANDLSDLASAATARTNLGLGTAAVTNTGTGATNTILGNDARLTDTRTPTDNTVSTAKLQNDAVTADKVADGAIDAAAKLVDGVVTAPKLETGLARNFTVADAAARGALANLREGDLCWQQDTDKRLYYTGAAWRYVPGQVLARVELTANVTSLGAGPAFITGLEVTFDALGGPVRVTAHYDLGASGTGGLMRSTYRTAGGTQIDVFDLNVIDAGDIGMMEGTIYETPAAGSTTRRVYHAGAGDPDMFASSDTKAYLEVLSA